ncbi:MAG: efflux RND transporter periplasmic adaptor subunit [Patescibacteria group bacterium]|jgi:RND family efflux transporter MFP subunit
MFNKIKGLFKKFVLGHKVVAGIVLAVVIAGGYFGWQALFGGKQQVSYVTAKAVKDIIISTVSGSGTVAASNEVELKTKASSDVTAVKVKKGDTVKAGEVLVQLNAKDAAKSVRDAQVNLDSAKLSLEKLQQPTSELSLIQARNSLIQSQQSKENSEYALIKAYEDAFNDISNAFLDLPTIMTDLNDILYSDEIGKAEKTVGSNQTNLPALLYSLAGEDQDGFQVYELSAESDYKVAYAKYQANFSSFKATNRYADNQTIETLLAETIENIKAVAQAAKSENNMLDVWVEDRSQNNWSIFNTVDGYQNDLSSDIGKVNNHVTTLLAIQQTLKTDKDAIANADRTIAEKTASLADLEAGVDELDLRAQQMSVQQRQNSLADALEQYANYSVVAPFDGVVANVAVTKGDTVSSGASAVTLITDQKIANISLNEVDVSKVKTGQKVSVTFDAISDLTVTGSVADVDMIGTVTQGVASYDVKIVFDSQNDQIKSGMTANVSIVIDSKVEALQVPSSAIKTQNSVTYVQIMVNGQPQQREVTIGLASDTMTEILSGINEGDEVVTQTVTANKSSTKTTSGNSNSNSRPQSGMLMGL